MGSSIALFGVQLAWPLAALIGVLTPLLIYAYLRRERRRKIIVSSLLLFSGLPQRARARRKFKPPWQFFLELLALVALVAALVRPFIISEDTQVAVLLDTSLSMQARDEQGQRSIDVILSQFADYLATQESSAVYTIYTSSPELSRIGTALGASEILPLLEENATPFASDTLERDFEQLATNPEYDEVVVLSDRPRAMASTSVDEHSPTLIGSKRRVQNVFIEQLEFAGGNQQQILASLGIASDSGREISFRLYATEQVGGTERLLHEESLQLRPPNGRQLRIRLADDARGMRFFRGVLQANPRAANGLEIDDTAWLAKERASSAQLALIGYPEGTAGLEALAGDSIKIFTAQEYANLGAAQLSSFDLLVFYATVPTQPPSRPSLFILPPEGANFLPVRETSDSLIISSWQAEHPLLRYLSVPLLRPQRSLLFEVPQWAQAIIRAEQGPIALAGMLNEQRVVALGFELLPFEGRATPTSSVLMLNVLQWLSGGSELTANFQIGSTLRLSNDRTWIVREPNGSLQTFPQGAERSEQYRFPSAGLYVVTSARPGSSETESRIYTVQGYISAESQTWQPVALSLIAKEQKTESAAEQQKDLWQYLALLALGLLCLQALLTSSKWRQRWI